MREFRQDLTGTTDANGNATIRVPMPQTGEWHNLKFGLSTVAFAEWAVQLSGSTVTYGRGRRVTLGPELVRDREVVTINVIGGPTNAQISGTASGVSGTPEQIVASFIPQPNTIALDTSIPRQSLLPDGVTTPVAGTGAAFSVGPSATVTNRFTLPVGTVAVRLLVNASGLTFAYDLLVLGHQTNEQYWGSPTAPGSSQTVPSPTLPFTIPIERDQDSQLDFTTHNQSAANTIQVFVSALFSPEAPGQAGASQSVFEPTPALWQAPNQAPKKFSIDMSVLGAATIIAAIAGQTIYLFDIFAIPSASGAFAGNWQDTNAVQLSSDTLQETGARPMHFSGAPLAAGVGLNFNVTANGVSFLVGHVAYSQG